MVSSIPPGSNNPHNSSCKATNFPSLKLAKLDEQDMQYTAGEVRRIYKWLFSRGPLHTDEQVLDDQLELIYNTAVRT